MPYVDVSERPDTSGLWVRIKQETQKKATPMPAAKATPKPAAKTTPKPAAKTAAPR